MVPSLAGAAEGFFLEKAMILFIDDIKFAVEGSLDLGPSEHMKFARWVNSIMGARFMVTEGRLSVSEDRSEGRLRLEFHRLIDQPQIVELLEVIRSQPHRQEFQPRDGGHPVLVHHPQCSACVAGTILALMKTEAG